MKICFIDAGIFIEKEELLNPLREIGEVSVYHGIPADADEVEARGKGADVIAFGLMQFTHEMIDRLPDLKVLQFIGTGVRNFVDVEYARSRGICVKNIEGYGSNAVAEFAVALGMAAARKVMAADRILKTDNWSIEGLLGMEIRGSVVGVVGTGSIGKLVAEKYAALGAEVIACDIYENTDLKENLNVKYMTMEEVFAKADLVTLHMKVTEENERIVGREILSKMKNEAILINVARAELVDTEALKEALDSGRIGCAAIDVYDFEPPAEADRRLARRDNVIATPHIGYYTQQANDNSIIMTVNSILESV